MAMRAVAFPPFSKQFQTDAEKDEINVKKKCFERAFAERDLRPFKLQWSFGINPAVPVINLTTEDRVLMAYACSHAAMIYDHNSRRMLPLLGHRNTVRTLSTTRDGKWLLTADFEQDCVAVVWDTAKGIPVRTLFNPRGGEGMTAARISPDANCIVTVDNGKCQNVYFWLWTHGRDTPDALMSLVDTLSERVKEITFNEQHLEQFALTTDYHVLFLSWDGHTLSCDQPQVLAKFQRIGIFNGSCYASKVQQVFTATTNGYVLMWGDVSRKKTHPIDDYRKKKHVKTFNLQKSNITVITDNEGMLVTGNSNGRVTFYDYHLRLLYWCESCDLDSIRWISFDLRSFTDLSKGSSAGKIALIEFARQKCHLVLHHPPAAVTSLDANPESNYVVVGDAQGALYLYNYDKRILTTSRNAPSLPDFRPILEKQETDGNFTYITCLQYHESMKAITALKFSPRCDMLACGLENGTIWILHHITLDPLEEMPYKHSSAAIKKIVFTPDAEYMAYADDALTVAVFRRNDIVASKEPNLWNLLGKYHSHYLPIRDVLFGPPASCSDVPRFFSLGEDRELVEYDLERSGPYPVPGLQILRVDRVEQSAIPLCLAWYPEFGAEKFLVISNSEYKYKVFCDVTKTIRGTYLGPTFGEPVQHFQILKNKFQDNNYMVFATDREIGLQLLPLDGNPHKIVGATGHPQKITGISVSSNREVVFTTGYNDPCVLMWKISLRSVDIMAQLGGEGLSPFYCLIEGGKNGWLMNEMEDLFRFAQILRGKYTTAVEVASDTVGVEQIPNLMRAVGYFPTNKEIETMMTEVRYKCFAETGELVKEITFEEFVRLYVNHRSVFELYAHQVKEAFRTFVEENLNDVETPTLTRKRLMNVLFGTLTEDDDETVGDPLTLQEAYTYLRLLVPPDEEVTETRRPDPTQRSFDFLPLRISYKDFTMDIMGIELPEETRADNLRKSARRLLAVL